MFARNAAPFVRGHSCLAQRSQDVHLFGIDLGAVAVPAAESGAQQRIRVLQGNRNHRAWRCGGFAIGVPPDGW